jgi:hypothetical protein
LVLSLLAVPGHAAVIQISQARALAGGVTPGDTPGFPVTISRPGSYILVTDVVVPATPGSTGILITAENVTLDLNGFSVAGPRVCAGNITTICPPGLEDTNYNLIKGGNNVTVVNGSVRGSAGNGLRLGGHARIERVNAVWNSLFGIWVGTGSAVRECLAAQNGEGIVGASEGMVVNNVVRSNVFAGLDLGSAGYAGNVISCTPVACVFGGIQTGTNLCNASPCP